MDTRRSDSGRINWQSVVEGTLRISVAILLGIAGYTFTWQMDHERRITVLEETRYSRRDARDDRDRIAESLAELQRSDSVTTAELKHIREILTKLADQIERGRDR